MFPALNLWHACTDREYGRHHWLVELRRVLHNGLVLLARIASVMLVPRLADVPDGEDLIEPIAILFFAVICNICYTLGWRVEVFWIAPSHWRRLLFRGGTLFTTGVAFLLRPLWPGGTTYRCSFTE